MAGLDLHEFDGPVSGKAPGNPVGASPSGIDRAGETRRISEAWARHATASCGFADVGGVPDDRSGVRAQRQF